MVAMRENEIETTTYFYCYNPRLRKFLGMDGGLRWKCKGFNRKTNKYYWTFEENEELSRLIEKYKSETKSTQIGL